MEMSGEQVDRGYQEHDLLDWKVLDGKDEHAIFSEHDLRWMTAGPLRDLLKSHSQTPLPERINKSKQIWARLLATLRSPESNEKNMTATCNAISVFLESACTSSDEELVAFGLSSATWHDCVDIVSSVYETGKVKATRQVLITLTNLLQTIQGRPQIEILKSAMLRMALDVIYTSKPRQQLKASVNIVELLLRRVLDLKGLIEGIQQCRVRNWSQWSRRLARDGMPVDGVLSPINGEDSDLKDDSASVELKLLVLTLWHDLVFTDLHLSTVGLFVGLAKKIKDSQFHGSLFSSSEQDPAPWATLLLRLLSIFPTALDTFAAHLFPRLIQLDPSGYRHFALHCTNGLPAVEEASITQISIQLAALQIGRQSGLFSTDDMTGWTIGSTQTLLVDLLSHARGEIRFRAFALLVNSPSTKESIGEDVLQAILSNLSFLFGDTDANNRSEIIRVSKGLISRLKSSSRLRHSDGQQMQLIYKSFLDSFVQFQERELGPTCSYQRHISALKMIEVLIGSGLDVELTSKSAHGLANDHTEFGFTVSLHSSSMVASLLNLLINPFQEVRIMTTGLLLTCLGYIQLYDEADLTVYQDQNSDSEKVSNGTRSLIRAQDFSHMLRRAEKLAMSTHRADHADGLGRLYALRYAETNDENKKKNTIDHLLTLVEQSLMEECEDSDLKAPLPHISIHGILIALRYCIDYTGTSFGLSARQLESSLLIDRLIKLCEVVWKKVRSRLCIDAPESEDDDLEFAGADGVGGPKDLLSYSWRALRDSSCLLASILTRVLSGTTIDPNDDHQRLQQFESIGNLCIEELSDLRHRGAFSTVAQTFATCCWVCSKSTIEGAAQLLAGWYQFGIRAIDEQAHRLTRRSAGLPAMVAAILAPSPSEVFNDFIRTFLRRATDKVNLSRDQSSTSLPQVHVLNCLREIFTNSKFRERTEEWVMSALKAATICLSSDLWAIRNCGLMLFRACTQRSCRPRDQALKQFQRSGLIESVSYIPLSRWPDSLNVALGLLTSDLPMSETSPVTLDDDKSHERIIGSRPLPITPIVQPERVFAGLDLLGRIKHSSESWEETLPYVLTHMGNRVWVIRDQAAQIYAANTDLDDGDIAIQELTKDLEGCSENQLHGRLLAIFRLFHGIRSLPKSQLPADLDQMLKEVSQVLLSVANNAKHSPPVRSKSIELLTEMMHLQETQTETTVAIDSFHAMAGSSADTISQDALIMKTLEPRLQQSITLHQCLSLLWMEKANVIHSSKGSQSLKEIYTELLVDDHNAAVTVLKELLAHQRTIGSTPSLTELLIEVVTSSTDEDVSILAIKGLANVLKDEPSDTTLAIPQNMDVLRTLRSPSGNKRLWNAKLYLRSIMLSRDISSKAAVAKCSSDCELCICLRGCEIALGDVTDVPTRSNALNCLKVLVEAIFGSFRWLSSEYSRHRLQPCLILLEALNDDDEDIRDEATTIERTIAMTGSFSIGVQPLAPLAASKRLLAYVLDSMGSTTSVQMTALKTITLNRHSTADELSNNIPSVLDSQFKQAMKTNYDLFEEEKQNLYADDARNIRIWTEALKKLESDTIQPEVMTIMKKWATQGLTKASDLFLNQQSQDDGPLGISWKPEVFTLLTSIISCAELVMYEEAEKEEVIRQQLLELRDIAVQIRAHGPILQHVESILMDVVV